LPATVLIPIPSSHAPSQTRSPRSTTRGPPLGAPAGPEQGDPPWPSPLRSSSRVEYIPERCGNCRTVFRPSEIPASLVPESSRRCAPAERGDHPRGVKNPASVRPMLSPKVDTAYRNGDTGRGDEASRQPARRQRRRGAGAQGRSGDVETGRGRWSIGQLVNWSIGRTSTTDGRQRARDGRGEEARGRFGARRQ
jgi:hypothetical protein